MGVIHASECPKVEQIPEADIREIEQIINGVAERREKDEKLKKTISAKENNRKHERKDSESGLQTIITDKWELFEEQQPLIVKNSDEEDPFAASMTLPAVHVHSKSQDLPDLISFL